MVHFYYNLSIDILEDETCTTKHSGDYSEKHEETTGIILHLVVSFSCYLGDNLWKIMHYINSQWIMRSKS